VLLRARRRENESARDGLEEASARRKSPTLKPALLILSIAALVLPTTALGKGPSGASLSGPGIASRITFKGYGSDAKSVGTLADQAGFVPAAFGQEPGPMLLRRPEGDLGPRHTITYTVPGPNNQADKVRQDVYPYALPRPVTYMKPGQKFFGSRLTHGGWFRANVCPRE
jgi:hypothetical protein